VLNEEGGSMQKRGVATFILAVLFCSTGVAFGQAPATPQRPALPPGAPARPAPDPPHARSGELVWNIAPADKAYASIDGADLKQFVAAQTAISRRYRDAGHQFWGRIIGTSADTENAEWIMNKFKEFGLSDVHEIPIDLQPQWTPESWSVAASANGGTVLNLETAQPTYTSVGTSADGLDLEGVFVGSGSEAELNLSKDVKGKAVFFVTPDLTSRHIGTSSGSIKRIADRGAAAIFIIVPIPETNYKTQFYPVGTQVPTFTLGQKDGVAIRDMIGNAAGTPVHVKIKMDVQMVPNEKTGTVWGTLPGTTDENVYVIAHRDGWFEGADDDGAGVATMVGLAEYFSKLPKGKRKRTLIFVGSTGHHNSGGQTGEWFSQHPELFAKTAVLFNCEHTGLADYVWYYGVPNVIRPTNAIGPLSWYVGGTSKLMDIASKDFDDFGIPTETNSLPAGGGEIGRYYWYAPSIQLLDTGYVWHSDHETDDTISAAGLAAVTRAYAKIIDQTDSIPLKDLRRDSPGHDAGN
jgi:hypothetical protein